MVGVEPVALTLITVAERAVENEAVVTVAEVVVNMALVVAMRVTATKHLEVSTCPLPIVKALPQEVEVAAKLRTDFSI